MLFRLAINLRPPKSGLEWINTNLVYWSCAILLQKIGSCEEEPVLKPSAEPQNKQTHPAYRKQFSLHFSFDLQVACVLQAKSNIQTYIHNYYLQCWDKNSRKSEWNCLIIKQTI